MPVRKRKWATKSGELRECYIADYVDQNGKRHGKNFDRKKEVEDWLLTAKGEVKAGTHTAESKSPTVLKAGELWLQQCTNEGLERATLAQYDQHLRLHIGPVIGGMKVAKLSAPVLAEFGDKLRERGCSQTMIRKVRISLGSLLADCQRGGLVSRNIVREQSRQRRRGGEAERHRELLQVGRDIPSPDEIRRILAAAEGRWRPLLVTACFTGLRASELRGLRWCDVDLSGTPKVHVRQRADRYNAAGSPKSKAGRREIPIGPVVANTLRLWRAEQQQRRLACSGYAADLDLVFPNTTGHYESRHAIADRGLNPAQKAAGVVDENGRPSTTFMLSGTSTPLSASTRWKLAA
jgi:integrase